LIYFNEKGLAYYDHTKKEYTELDTLGTTWSIFNHQWLLKQQLNAEEFIFIPGASNTIIYYHHGLKKTVESPMPEEIHYAFNWSSRIAMMNDSTFIINGRIKGFYMFHLHRATGQISCDETKYLPDYEILYPFVDKDNRVWFGTPNGVLQQKLRPPVIHSYHYPPAKGEAYTGGFTTVYKYKGVLYAGRFFPQ
jgi:hypothetical protein